MVEILSKEKKTNKPVFTYDHEGLDQHRKCGLSVICSDISPQCKNAFNNLIRFLLGTGVAVLVNMLLPEQLVKFQSHRVEN